MTAALDRAVANALGLKSVHNCEKWRRAMTEEDDDTQVYKKPWVGLTEEEIIEISHLALTRVQAVQMTEAKLKEKNA